MRKTIVSILLMGFTLTSCGGSNDNSRLTGAGGVSGNFIRTTVNVERSFVYALSSQSSLLSGYVVAPAEEGEEEESTFEITALDGSPFTLAQGSVVDLVSDGEGQSLYLLTASGQIDIWTIDGFTGLLTLTGQVSTPVANARLLRVSTGGETLAVLGDDLAVYAIGEGGLSAPAVLQGTQAWTDVRLSGGMGVGATSAGAVGFTFSPGVTIAAQTALPLPGNSRGQAVYIGSDVYVVNTADRSVSQLSQQAGGPLTLEQTFPLPAGLADPQTICALSENDLLVGDSDSVARLHIDESNLSPEAEADLDQTPTVLFPVPDTDQVLVGHEQGFGFTVLTSNEDVLELSGEADDQQPGASAFAFARRAEEVTRTTTP